MPIDSGIEAALDARHAEAAAAFASRDIEAYRDLFSASLRYRQADGRVIGRDRLMADVKAQFRRLDWAESRYTRETLAIEGSRAAETLLQTASAGTSAFGILHRIWRLTRRGRYLRTRSKWKRGGGASLVLALIDHAPARARGGVPPPSSDRPRSA